VDGEHADTGEARARRSAGAPGKLRATLTVLCSIAVGLLVAEHAAAAARGHAFPFLDVFEPDRDLGVRLRPGAETRIRTFSGRITDVRINDDGFRGAAWPVETAPAAGALRVLLVGDSQVFGLHAQFEDTFAGQLGQDAEVLDAAVPTYGPAEHVASIERLAPRWHPTHVVWLPYVGNDWQEAPILNLRRTTATTDGFATMVGAHPPSGPWTLFPHSHLAFAVRSIAGRALEARPPRADARLSLIQEADRFQTDGARSRLAPFLERAIAAAQATGAVLIVAAIPVDVQADDREWEKYHHAPVDAAPVTALVDTFLEETRARGVTAIDLLPPLRAAEPGAFLPDDEHLSPRGHQVVATALRSALLPDVPQRPRGESP
jgi:hypothetical protein